MLSKPPNGDRQKGFTLIELCVCVIILAILLAMLTALVQFAVQRARIVRTEADIRAAGQAWCLEYSGFYPQIGIGALPPVPVPISDFPVTLAPPDLPIWEVALNAQLPLIDAWGNDIEYRVDSSDPNTAERFMIRSQNANAQWDDPYTWKTFFPVSDRDTDIVWVNCDWVQLHN